jgi:hypothetical protein
MLPIKQEEGEPKRKTEGVKNDDAPPSPIPQPIDLIKQEDGEPERNHVVEDDDSPQSPIPKPNKIDVKQEKEPEKKTGGGRTMRTAGKLTPEQNIRIDKQREKREEEKKEWWLQNGERFMKEKEVRKKVQEAAALKWSNPAPVGERASKRIKVSKDKRSENL